MIRVYTVKPHYSGFGTYDRGSDSQKFEHLSTVRDYTDLVQENNDNVRLVEEGDEGYAKVEDADGRIDGQDGGTVIGWESKYDYSAIEAGDVLLELVVAD